MTTLGHWQIVIMRPAHQAKALADYVIAHEGHPLLLPMIQITPCVVSKEAINALSEADIIIVSSQNAVTCAAAEIIEFLAKRVDSHIITLGAATSAALAKHNIIASYTAPPGGHSEALLTLDRLQVEVVRNKRVVLLAGKGGRDVLEKELRVRQAKVTTLQTYEQVAIHYDLLHHIETWQQNTRQTCLIVTSLNILHHLFSQTPEKLLPWLRAQPLIVVSERIEQAASKYGSQHIINAKGADFASLIKALQSLVKVCNTKG